MQEDEDGRGNFLVTCRVKILVLPLVRVSLLLPDESH